MSAIRLRNTTEKDLDFVLRAEGDDTNRGFVTVWSPERHLAAIGSDDFSHLIIESPGEAGPVGYVILAGLTDPNQTVELLRIVVTAKSKGYGRATLRLIKHRVFDEWKAHRLWLDVKEHNSRARRLYESEAFIVEGTLRECVRTENGFESLVIMSILQPEYEAKGW